MIREGDVVVAPGGQTCIGKDALEHPPGGVHGIEASGIHPCLQHLFSTDDQVVAPLGGYGMGDCEKDNQGQLIESQFLVLVEVDNSKPG